MTMMNNACAEVSCMFLCNKIEYESAPKLIDFNASLLYENYRAKYDFNMKNVTSS